MYRAIIQKSIDYIESNLMTDITVEELSQISSFSVFHYYRVFQSVVGMPVMKYIVRRRLLHALYDMHCGKKIIDVALNYGFETQAGFYKAFVREFGYTPTEFLYMSKKKKPRKVDLFKEKHIMISHGKLKEILKNWGLENEKLMDIVYAETGNISESACYIGDDYVIKYSFNYGNVERHILLSQAIESVGLLTATPVKTKEGEFVITNDNMYFYVTKRLAGEQLKASMMYTEEGLLKARFVGNILGKLSIALEKVDEVVNQDNVYDSVKLWALPILKEKMNFPKNFIETYIKEFGDIYDSLPQQIVHRDPNPGNIILNNGEWGILDFDLSERNVRIFDPCYAATAILSESFEPDNLKKMGEWIMIYKNIMQGYDESVKLSKDEWKAIPYVVMANQFLATAWFSEQEKHSELYEINKKMTEWMLTNFDELTTLNSCAKIPIIT